MMQKRILSYLRVFLIFLVVAGLVITASLVAGKTVMKTLYPKKYENIVTKYSEEYSVDKELVFAVIRTESSFDPTSVSSVGAMGLMQIMPETYEWLSAKLKEEISISMMYDEDTGIRYGVYLLKILIDEFKNERTAIAAYHAGIGCVSRWLEDDRYSSDGITLHTIPYSDTAHYVSKVERTVRIYENLY